MSSKAFTPWWRLLHNSIGHRIKLHQWNSSHFDTPSNFWMDVYFALDKPEYLSSEIAVWTALIALSKLDSSHCTPEDLAMLAWSRPAAVNMFKDEHQIYIQKYLEANATPV
ncbi:hypothetical protein BDB01DRAFT_815069 [Pilobolus umbonatus]|nr:hypothetical protein BDB01DRAFT_815069 [Pilobolus umbonatus]